MEISENRLFPFISYAKACYYAWLILPIRQAVVARAIRKAVGAETPIIIISAYDWSSIEEEALAAGVNGFLSKPLFKSTLLQCLMGYAQGAPRQKTPPAAPQADLRGRRVLVAEDNDLNWEIAQELLSAHQIEAERAVNGQDCLDRFSQAAPGWYDAVLMDILMPVLNGYEAARRLRALPRSDAGLPIIAMTADAFTEDVRRCLEAGMDAHVPKPIDIRQLLLVLQRYLPNRHGNGV